MGISAIVQNSFKNYTSDLTRHHKFTAISSFISCFDLPACAIIVNDFTLRNFLHDECFFSVIKKKKKLVKGKSSKPILRRGLIIKRSFLGQNWVAGLSSKPHTHTHRWTWKLGKNHEYVNLINHMKEEKTRKRKLGRRKARKARKPGKK